MVRPIATRSAVWKDRSAPILTSIDDWLEHHRARASAKSPLGKALALLAKYRNFRHFVTGGRIEVNSNTFDRTIRSIAVACAFRAHPAIHSNLIRSPIPGHPATPSG